MPLDIETVYQLTDTQVKDLCKLYTMTWWAKDRQLADVQRMLAKSDTIVGLSDRSSGSLLGFTRVLSDSVYRAVIFDVVVRDDLRGQGIGRQLIDAVLAHPELQNVEAICLFCTPEMPSFYEKFGFSTAPNVHFMTRSVGYLKSCESKD